MRLPSPSAHYSARVRFGRYVARRLRRAGFDALSADVTKITDSVRSLGRAYEDADGAIQDALADRDGADDDLDDAAKESRATLAGRGVTAYQEPPYTLIFPQGVAYYTAAPLDQEEDRYLELKKRLEEHLSAKDDVLKKAPKAIDAGIKQFKAASQELASARTEESLAATRLQAAEDAYDWQLEKTYGALVSEVGRGRADAFFPAAKAGKPKSKDKPAKPGDA